MKSLCAVEKLHLFFDWFVSTFFVGDFLGFLFRFRRAFQLGGRETTSKFQQLTRRCRFRFQI
jgi:hypothetical protein